MYVIMTSIAVSEKQEIIHKLNSKWILWAHLPHNTDWSLKSYIKVYEINSVESIIKLINNIPDIMITNCMLFLMRDNINPTWEDPNNIDGGCFSFKITNNKVINIWKKLNYLITGETLSEKNEFMNNVNGITISPKKQFCIIKIWMKNLDYQSPSDIVNIEGLTISGCLFKRHKN
ncbi:MAG: hypothetical protein CBB97_08775 [Candidatus Endolissoclinum sp. TMED37]|nr:MAG: hypothetical protein CBB97_08775 [Candidatus Endolissoclinum sp. TMED37]